MVDWTAKGKVMPDFARLENKQRQGAQQAGDLPQWAVLQQKVFTNWINNKLTEHTTLMVCDLFEDLKDGTVLYGLLEVLSRQSLSSLGKVKPEKNKIKKIANMNTVWKYLSNTVKLVGIGPTDIVDGNVTLTLGMIWSLIVFFMAKDLGDAGDGLGVLKKRIMEWLRKRTRNFPDVSVTDFSHSLADGKALLAVLNDYDPEASPYEPTDSPAENLRRAFESFRRLYGVGSILDPDDPQCCADDKANMTYLAEVMKAMPTREGEWGSEEEMQHRREGLMHMASERSIELDTEKGALKRADKLAPKVLEYLRELCSFGPDDGKACAAKVADMMVSAGLNNVKVVKPSQDRQDPSMRGDPFVIGEKVGRTGTPLVLFYSSYGTVDEAAASPSSGKPVDAGDESGASEQWASDPLCLSPIPEPPEEEGSSGARLSARGVSQDKANVVAQIAAIEALLQGVLPCNVKVVIGATPPPASLEGNAPLEVADRMADFLRVHSAMTGLPDIIVVSEPSGARLAPGKNALLVGCRGSASLQLTVSTLEDKGKATRCADYGGPLIDPARVLSNILASIHDPETGALKVKGLSGAPDAASLERVKDLTYDEAQLRADSGYLSQVDCAQEVYERNAPVKEQSDACSDDVEHHHEPIPASVVEHLTVLPAVTVTSMSTVSPSFSTSNNSYDGGLLGSTFPEAASAGIHLCLSPGREHAPATQAFQAHCEKYTPHGAKVRFDKIEGRTGWQTPLGVPLVDGVLASLRGEGGDDDAEREGRGGGKEGEEKSAEGGVVVRETVMASSPGFSAVPSAFASALPSSAVVGVGVNDPQSRPGAPNENILVEDLKLFVWSAVRMVHGVAKGGGGGGGDASLRQSDQAARGVAYTNRVVDKVERLSAVNQLRSRRSNVPSPMGSACASPARSLSGGMNNGRTGGNTFERSQPPGFGGRSSTTAKHPLSPKRSTTSTLGWEMPPKSPPRAISAPAAAVDPGTALQAQAKESTSLVPSGVVPELPPAPSAAMAAFAAAMLGQMGMVDGVPSTNGGVVAHEEDDDKVGGATPEKILAEINELRTDPKAYATKLEDLLQYYDKGMYKSPTGPPLQTTEGDIPVLEAIAMLKATEPLEALESKAGMQRAAADHFKDLALTGRTGHLGSDGSRAVDRINRYGELKMSGEVCAYLDATTSGIVAQLLVADGERSRESRKALLANRFKVCGIALGKHPTVGVACVITLADWHIPLPLSYAADVVCEVGETPSTEFRLVLKSIPGKIAEEVETCIRIGIQVQMQYEPGNVKVTFLQDSGARRVMGCSWD